MTVIPEQKEHKDPLVNIIDSLSRCRLALLDIARVIKSVDDGHIEPDAALEQIRNILKSPFAD